MGRMQDPGFFDSDGQKLPCSLHLLYLPGQCHVTLNDQGALLGVADQGLLSRAEHAHQWEGLLRRQVKLSDGCRVGDGVAVDAIVAEGATHALFLVEGREDLFVAVDDILDTSGWGKEGERGDEWEDGCSVKTGNSSLASSHYGSRK